MAIFYNTKEISSLGFGDKIIAYVYYGDKLVWSMIMSCFDTFWSNDKAWDNKAPWRNNK